MIIWRAAACLLCVLWGTSALAEPIPVSSGEHGTFSRLVFEGQTLSGWTYDENGGDHVVKFPNQTDGFLTQSIYRYISNDRLNSFASNKSEFQFEIDCACDVEIFEIGTTVLVVDIKTQKSIGKQEILLGFPTASLRSAPLEFGAWTTDTVAVKPIHLVEISRLKTRNEIGIKPESPTETVLPTKRNIPAFGTAPTAPPTDSQIQAIKSLQTQLLREIGSASSQGVLEANTTLSLRTEVEKRPQVDPRVFDSSHDQLLAEQPETTQIRITSSADIKQSEGLAANTTLSGRVCIDPARVDISAWSDGRYFEQQLGAHRRGLFGEFDQLDPITAIKLARLYLHYGFGAEARGILVLIDDGRQNWPELFEMAQVLEYGFAQNGRVLHQYVDCNSAGALWAILASEELDPNRSIDVQAAVRSVDALPAHLRKFLAPELSKRLLKYGDRVGAKTAMRNLDRLSTPADERATLAKAEIEISKGGLEAAGVLLNEVVNSNSEFSARALISLIETEMDTGRPIDVATANLVDAYAMELRDAPIGAELLRVHVLALAKSGQFKESFTALDALDFDEEAKTLPTKLLQLLVASAGDADFLELMFERMSKFVEIDEKKHIFDAATRLQALGFSETAEQLLIDGGALSNSRARRILRAKIALDLGRPAAADVLLVNLDGEDAAALRAQVKERKLERVTAHEMYSQLDDTQAAQENAWLSDDWQTLTDPAAAAFGSLVPVANQNLEQSDSTIGMMARSQSLLAESSQVRDTISNILQKNTE
jgi:hypothetical protein